METQKRDLNKAERSALILGLAADGTIDRYTEKEIEAIAYQPLAQWPESLKERVFGDRIADFR
jgi:hypothetical protein